MIPRALAAVACGTLLAASSGCLGGGSSPQTGVRIGDITLKQFTAGVTTEEWVLAVLGEPSGESYVANLPNTKVLRYALQRKPSGPLAFITGGGAEVTSVVYFIITDGIVTRFWADRAVEYSLLGTPVEQGGSKSEQ